MEKIIFYGLGVDFERNKEFFERRFEVVGYSDKRDTILRTIKPDDIYKYEFDYILVSSRKYFEEIKDELITQYYISRDKIISSIGMLKIKYNLENSLNRGTSATDNDIYPAFCRIASKDEEEFADFRKNPIITQTYEHVTQCQGREYLSVINQNFNVKFSLNDWEDFAKNDLYGLPNKYSYNIWGGAIRNFSNYFTLCKSLTRCLVSF